MVTVRPEPLLRSRSGTTSCTPDALNVSSTYITLPTFRIRKIQKKDPRRSMFHHDKLVPAPLVNNIILAFSTMMGTAFFVHIGLLIDASRCRGWGRASLVILQNTLCTLLNQRRNIEGLCYFDQNHARWESRIMQLWRSSITSTTQIK